MAGMTTLTMKLHGGACVSRQNQVKPGPGPPPPPRPDLEAGEAY